MELKSLLALVTVLVANMASVAMGGGDGVVSDEASMVTYITDDYGMISSASFPRNYPNNINKTWVITTEENYVIELNFIDFYLEASYDEDQGGPCVYDYVRISDGDDEEQLCGSRHKYKDYAPSIKPYVSDSNRVTINFVSDYSNEGEDETYGFRVIYRKIDRDECELMRNGELHPDANWDESLYCNYKCVNTPGSYRCFCQPGFTLHSDQHTCKRQCNDEIITESGIISTWQYPGKYTKFADCKWIIRAEEDKQIKLMFDLEFAIEDHLDEDDCPYDRLTITDGDGLENVYCGEQAPSLGDIMTFVSNEVVLHFTSDRTVENTGFNCTVMIVDRE